MPRRRFRSKWLKASRESAASQVFTCVDSVDEITQFFGLLDMCLDEVQGSSDVETCVYLLVDSFVLQVRPRLEKLHANLYSIYKDLQ